MANTTTTQEQQLATLTKEEREVLMKVMERAKEFDKANSSKVIEMNLEGQLYKWTNPLKGWQPRWFYVDHDQGVLHYYTSEDKRKLPPRASLSLWGAVVSPSDEDSQSFAVQAANSETYRLRAADAKDRQYWVSRLRQEVEHANKLAAGSKEILQSSSQSTPYPLSPPTSTNHTATTKSSSGNNISNTGATPTKKLAKKSQSSTPLHLSIPKLANKKGRIRRVGSTEEAGNEGVALFQEDADDMLLGGDSILGSLTALQTLQDKLTQQLENSEAAGVLPHDKNLLLLKATSQAAVYSVQDCLAMMNIQLGHHSRGTSPSQSNPLLSSPSSGFNNRRTRPRPKRPTSMIEPRDKQQKEAISNSKDRDSFWAEEDEEGLIRSVSVSEVKKPAVVDKNKFPKESPQ